MIKTVFLVFLVLSVGAGCTFLEKSPEKEADPENLFFDYSIRAEEGKEEVICRFQYRLGGPAGDAVLIEPGMVTIDGEKIAPDSARFTGGYYEINKPLAEFSGTHEVIFTNPAGKKYSEKIEFIPFSLAKELPAKIRREPFKIKLDHFPKRETPLRLVVTDTSFGTSWINEVIAVVNAEVAITGPMLAGLKSGPLSLELYREELKPLSSVTRAGGRLELTYVLKRETELE